MKDTGNQWLRKHIAGLRGAETLASRDEKSRIFRAARLAPSLAHSLIRSILKYFFVLQQQLLQLQLLIERMLCGHFKTI